jgi:hypothetical protein
VSIREEVAEDEGVVDIVRNVEIVTENTAMYLSDISDKIRLHGAVVTICVVEMVDVISPKH